VRVAVLGAGAVGLASACVLREHGHEPVVWSHSGKLAAGPVTAAGALAGRFEIDVAPSPGAAVAEAEAVLLTAPGFAHRAIMDVTAPHLRAGQTVIISSHSSFGALYLAQRAAVPVVAWGTTVAMARRTGPAEVQIGAVRSRIDAASLPVSAADAGIALCRTLFGDRFVPRDDVLAISLSNLNPQNHLAQVLCNFTRIERGEAWANWDGYTPSVARLIEALDAERLAIARAFGIEVRTARQHFHLSTGVPEGPLAGMLAAIAGRDRTTPGPRSIETRYVLEDVPFGLVPTSLLGRVAGVPATLHDAGIDMLSALYGRDFRAENDILPLLGMKGMPPDALRRLLRDGKPRR
jgi:opine dehydrogenase